MAQQKKSTQSKTEEVKEQVIDSKKAGKSRADWEKNNIIIMRSFKKLMKKLETIPMVIEIAADTGLNEETIRRHMKTFSFDAVKEQMQTLTPDVMQSIYDSARRGNSQAQKLWVQVVNDWKESQNHNLTVNSWADAMNNLLKEPNEQERD